MMKRFSTVFVFACLLSLGHAAERVLARTPAEVLVVYNVNSPTSKSIADDYVQNRQVTHVLAIQCVDSALTSDNETLSFADYTKLIEAPIRNLLASSATINFIVLTKGIPIRVNGGTTGSRGDSTPANAPLNASVDSYLAAMDYSTISDAKKIAITGSGATGFCWLNRYWNATEPFSHAKFGGYLVTRLDGYTVTDAKSLVARALVAETKLSKGKVLLDVQPAFGVGDKSAQPAPITVTPITAESDYADFNADMEHAYDILIAKKIPVILDKSPKFMGAHAGLLGYFSWGSNDAKFTNKAYQSLKFAPGSIGDTAVSTSGRTFLPTQGGQTMIADLIAHGLTCCKGYTDEPLLQAISSPTIALDRFTAGYTMAESFYAASHFVGWTDIVIGDPLCCPYLLISK